MSALPDLRSPRPFDASSVSAAVGALLGQFDDDVVGAAAVTLSRLIGDRYDRRGGDIYEVNATLARYPRVACDDTDVTHISSARARHPSSVLAKLGLQRSDLNAEWSRRVADDGVRAAFDAPLLLALFPVSSVGALCAIVVDGPALAVERIESLLHHRSQQAVKSTRARPDGGLVSRRTLAANVAPVRWLLDQLTDLQRRDFPCGSLHQWQWVPKIRMPRAEPANTDGSAPPLILLRRTYAGLDRKVKERLGVAHDIDEGPRVRAMGRTSLKICGVWRLARTRALLGLSFALGGRRGAVCRLKRSDVVRDHLGPDGHRGPAIALRPAKVYDEREIHWKPIPHELLRVIDLYLSLTDRLVAETDHDLKHNGRRRRPAPGPEAPLFIGHLKYPERALTPGGFYQQLVGHTGYPKHNIKPRTPLIPKGDGAGFSPHTLRRAALQATRVAAAEYCRKHDCAVTEEGISAALLDHTMPSDRYGYADVNTLAGREKCA